MYYAYNQAGKDLGPFTLEQLQAKLDSGEFPSDKLVRAETSKDGWQTLNTLSVKPRLSVLDKIALPSIDATTHCHVFCGGKQHGPYMPQQIQVMWSAGTLTADTSVFPDGYPDWIPIADFLTRVARQNAKEKVTSSSARPFGYALIVIGVLVTFYFATFYDTSVQTGRHYIPGVGSVGGETVVNLAKQQNRLIGVIVGLAMSVIGIVVVYLPTKSNDAS